MADLPKIEWAQEGHRNIGRLHSDGKVFQCASVGADHYPHITRRRLAVWIYDAAGFDRRDIVVWADAQRC